MSENQKKVEVSQEDLEKLKVSPQKTKQADQMEEIKKNMAKFKHKIIVCSGKGGVGKSTVATNLAVALANKGFSVGILDVDITGPNIPKMLNLEGQRLEVDAETQRFIPANGPLNIKVMSMAFLLETPDTPVIWRGPMKMGAIRQFIAEGRWGELDYLITDLPPGTSDETLDVMQLSNGSVIVVTTPQDVATLDSRKTVMMAKTMHLDTLGIIENMSGYIHKCPKCGEETRIDLFGAGGGEMAARDLEVPFLGRIPIEKEVMEQGDLGLPFVMKYPDSASAKAFEAIVEKIQKMLNEPMSKPIGP